MSKGARAVSWVLAGLALTAAGAALQEPERGVRRTVYVLEVDLSIARALAWAEAEASDAAVLEAAAGVVRKRLAAMECSFELRTDVEERRIELAMPQVQPRDRELFAQMLRGIGVCELALVAGDEHFSALETDAFAEALKLLAWRAENEDAPIAAFNGLADPERAPHPRILWVEPSVEAELPFPVLLPAGPDDCFGAGSFARTEPIPDADGEPALLFELLETRVEDFRRFTGEHVGESLAIVIADELHAAPTLREALEGGGVIESGLTEEDVARLVESFTELEGPLRVVETR